MVENILDDFTTPVKPTYLAPSPSIPILLTKNTHELESNSTGNNNCHPEIS